MSPSEVCANLYLSAHVCVCVSVNNIGLGHRIDNCVRHLLGFGGLTGMLSLANKMVDVHKEIWRLTAVFCLCKLFAWGIVAASHGIDNRMQRKFDGFISDNVITRANQQLNHAVVEWRTYALHSLIAYGFMHAHMCAYYPQTNKFCQLGYI